MRVAGGLTIRGGHVWRGLLAVAVYTATLGALAGSAAAHETGFIGHTAWTSSAPARGSKLLSGTSFVVDGQTINHASDAAGARAVGDSIESVP
jgi:hypothetical protein